VLALLPKLQGPLKKVFRAERRRLLAVQNRVRLDACHVSKGKAAYYLHEVTWQIAKAKPATAAGALALIGYVESRSREESCQKFFSERGEMPGQFSQVLRAAHQRLQQSIAA
jgi:hypothetical protein